MSSAKLTLIGLYQWLQHENIDMFESFKYLPNEIDVSVLSNMILSEGGEFEPLYANAYMMKDNVQMFVMNHLRTFTKWMDALSIEYNPLENYDRMEDWSDENHNKASSNGNISGNNNTTEQSSVNNSVSAYDSSSMSPHDMSSTNSSNNVATNSNSSSNGSSDANSTHTGRTHGNIGVTTSQQMLQSELDIARFNIYKQICDLFIDELLLGVYV